MYKVDVEESFLLGKLNEDIFVSVTDGFDEAGIIEKLNSSIYVLVQASRVFYETIRSFLVDSMGFNVCNSGGCILVKKKLIIGLYVMTS